MVPANGQCSLVSVYEPFFAPESEAYMIPLIGLT